MHIDNDNFSEREKDVIKLLLQGKGNKQIALELRIANRTVEYHLTNIYFKLGVNSRSEAILKLTETHLRESTTVNLRDSTGMEMDKAGDNVRTPISTWRIPLNKSFVIGFSVLFVTTVFCLGTMYIMAKERASVQDPTGSTSTPVATDLAPSETIIPTPIIASPTITPTAPILIPQPTNSILQSHTVNGYTASIEAYYADISRLSFQVRITGGGIEFGDENYFSRISSPNLYDEYGNMINTSGGGGPAMDPALYQFELVPVTLFTGDRIKGQFAFDLVNPPNYNQKLAQFRFDFDLPLYQETRFYPKQVVTANGLEMLLDSVTVTPAFTQIYLCFSPPSFAPWTVGSQTVLQMGEQEVPLYSSSELFSSATGNYWGIRSEPYWVPPVKNGSCYKIGFPAGSSIPTSFTLTIPKLEKLDPEMLMIPQLSANYPGLSPKQAYYTYLEEHGQTYKGPWVFRVDLS